MIRGDYHTHHYRCGHALGEIEEYVVAAMQLGFEEIGITDHGPAYWVSGDHPWPGSAMARSQLPDYVREVLELKDRYRGRIRVLLGLEADYVPGHLDLCREMLAEHPFDYVIGSVHYCLGHHIYNVKQWHGAVDAASIYREYFRLIRESAGCGLFDILGHITGILAYGPQVPEAILIEEFDATAKAVAHGGVAIEINASGVRKGGHHPFPASPLLQRCIAADVPIAYGSDSHHPSEVGHSIELANLLARGARKWTCTQSD